VNLNRTSYASYFLLNAGDPPPAPGGGKAPPAPGAPPAASPPAPAAGDTPPAPGADHKPSAVNDKPPETKPSAVNDPPPAPFEAAKLQLPEGMKTDDPLFTKFSGLMTDEKLSPHERGQQMLNLYSDAVKASREASKEAWNNVQKEWSTKTTSDPEIGGAKWDSTKTTIAKVIDGLGPELASGLREALDVTGAGNHPAVAKALFKWASMLTEGTYVQGKGPAESTPDLAKTFFPNSQMRKK
jgi:hypothetical protein